MKADDAKPGKVYLIDGDTLRDLIKSVAEWKNLVVKMTGSKVAKLTRGEAQSVLEIPNPGGAGETDTDHPLKVVKSGAMTVQVISGTVGYRTTPTIGGVSISAATPPNLTVTGQGWVVLVTTWDDDYVTRSYPLTSSFVFEAGDPTLAYAPPSADTRTEARLPHAKIFVTGEGEEMGISNIETTPSGNLAVARYPYSNTGVTFQAGRA